MGVCSCESVCWACRPAEVCDRHLLRCTVTSPVFLWSEWSEDTRALTSRSISATLLVQVHLSVIGWSPVSGCVSSLQPGFRLASSSSSSSLPAAVGYLILRFFCFYWFLLLLQSTRPPLTVCVFNSASSAFSAESPFFIHSCSPCLNGQMQFRTWCCVSVCHSTSGALITIDVVDRLWGSLESGLHRQKFPNKSALFGSITPSAGRR